jgi:hypothetical protein
VLKGAFSFLKRLMVKPVFLNSITVIVYRPRVNARFYCYGIKRFYYFSGYKHQ